MGRPVARGGAGFWLLGSLVIAASLIGPQGERTDTRALLILSGVCLTMAAIQWVTASRISPVALRGCGLLAATVMSLIVYFEHDPTADTQMLYMFVVIYAFGVYGLRPAMLELSFVGIAYAVVIVADGGEGAAVARWLYTMVTALGVGLCVASLTNRVNWLVRQLSNAAETDALTGLRNRRGLEADLARELQHAKVSGTCLGLVMVDLDHFKRINDQLGHGVGDQTLGALGNVLKGAVRAADRVARYGGEEFVIGLPGTDRESAAMVADKVRRSVQEAETPAGTITISAGVAAYPADGEDVERLLAVADTRLYLAKNGGRNRVCASDAPDRRSPRPSAPRPAATEAAPAPAG